MNLSNPEVVVLAKIKQLASINQYLLTKHARLQMIDRNMTTDDVNDILCNPKSILRINDDNLDGITTYKIKGGSQNHRLAIKFITSQTESIVVITVMDNQGKK